MAKKESFYQLLTDITPNKIYVESFQQSGTFLETKKMILLK